MPPPTSLPPSTTEQRSGPNSGPAADTRAEILDAAHELVFDRGYSATTVDAILGVTGTSKGSFFHHFPTKAALGRALLERYAAMDAEVLEDAMSRAEALTSDPAEQLVAFVRAFEDDLEAGVITQRGCLFASFVYERIPDEVESDVVILGAIARWRDRILGKLQEAAATRPLAVEVDLASLADQVWTVFEGGFVLARATDDPLRLRDQLAHLRVYLSLLLGVRTPPPDADRP